MPPLICPIVSHAGAKLRRRRGDAAAWGGGGSSRGQSFVLTFTVGVGSQAATGRSDSRMHTVVIDQPTRGHDGFRRQPGCTRVIGPM